MVCPRRTHAALPLVPSQFETDHVAEHPDPTHQPSRHDELLLRLILNQPSLFWHHPARSPCGKMPPKRAITQSTTARDLPAGSLILTGRKRASDSRSQLPTAPRKRVPRHVPKKSFYEKFRPAPNHSDSPSTARPPIQALTSPPREVLLPREQKGGEGHGESINGDMLSSELKKISSIPRNPPTTNKAKTLTGRKEKDTVATAPAPVSSKATIVARMTANAAEKGRSVNKIQYQKAVSSRKIATKKPGESPKEENNFAVLASLDPWEVPTGGDDPNGRATGANMSSNKTPATAFLSDSSSGKQGRRSSARDKGNMPTGHEINSWDDGQSGRNLQLARNSALGGIPSKSKASSVQNAGNRSHCYSGVVHAHGFASTKGKPRAEPTRDACLLPSTSPVSMMSNTTAPENNQEDIEHIVGSHPFAAIIVPSDESSVYSGDDDLLDFVNPDAISKRKPLAPQIGRGRHGNHNVSLSDDRHSLVPTHDGIVPCTQGLTTSVETSSDVSSVACHIQDRHPTNTGPSRWLPKHSVNIQNQRPRSQEMSLNSPEQVLDSSPPRRNEPRPSAYSAGSLHSLSVGRKGPLKSGPSPHLPRSAIQPKIVVTPASQPSLRYEKQRQRSKLQLLDSHSTNKEIQLESNMRSPQPLVTRFNDFSSSTSGNTRSPFRDRGEQIYGQSGKRQLDAISCDDGPGPKKARVQEPVRDSTYKSATSQPDISKPPPSAPRSFRYYDAIDDDPFMDAPTKVLPRPSRFDQRLLRPGPEPATRVSTTTPPRGRQCGSISTRLMHALTSAGKLGKDGESMGTVAGTSPVDGLSSSPRFGEGRVWEAGPYGDTIGQTMHGIVTVSSTGRSFPGSKLTKLPL